MIEKTYGKYELGCDRCGRYVGGFVSFQDALDYAEEQGWTRLNIYGEWENFCDECSESSDSDIEGDAYHEWENMPDHGQE